MTEGESYGAVTLQPKQLLEEQGASLKPFLRFCILRLRLALGFSRIEECLSWSAVARKDLDQGPGEEEILCFKSSKGVTGEVSFAIPLPFPSVEDASISKLSYKLQRSSALGNPDKHDGSCTGGHFSGREKAILGAI